MLANLPDAVQAAAQVWLSAGVLEHVDEATTPPKAGLDPATELLTQLLAGLDGTEDPAQATLRPVVEAVGASPTVQLTPLGAYGLRRLLLAHGWQSPVLGDCSDLAPGELLDRLEAYPPGDSLAEAAVWLEARGEQWANALDGVMESARTIDAMQGPLRRLALREVLRAAGPRITTVLDCLTGDPLLGPVAAEVRHA